MSNQISIGFELTFNYCSLYQIRDYHYQRNVKRERERDSLLVLSHSFEGHLKLSLSLALCVRVCVCVCVRDIYDRLMSIIMCELES